MTAPDLSWMLKDIVDNVPKARHAVLLSADGLSRGATEALPEKDVRTVSAAMSAMQALSRAIASFVAPVTDEQWQQTIIEFSHGWNFLIGAGQGAYLAAAAEPEVDMQQISFRMHRLVARLRSNMTSPPRVTADDATAGSTAGPAERAAVDSPGSVIADLDAVIADVKGARHAVLLGLDGLPRGATSGMNRDLVDTLSASMKGLHAYSRATSRFAGAVADPQWRQTVVEFSQGWVFLIDAGGGCLLAAAAAHDADIEEFTTRLHEAVRQLNAGRSRHEEGRGNA